MRLLVLSFAPALLFGGDWIGSLGGRAVQGSDGRITDVNLRASWVSDGDLLELARIPGLQNLNLSRTRITDQGLSYLKGARDLREVDLSYAEKIGDPAHAVIKEWKNLTRLSLRGTVVADETAAAAATLPHLEYLDLADTIVGDNGVEALARAPKLRELLLGNSRIGELGYQSLRQFTNLARLDLAGAQPRGTPRINEKALAAVSSLTQLRELNLGHLRFPVRSFESLKALTNLERLGLAFASEVSDEAIPHLVAWKSLRWVDLHGTKVTAEGVAALRQQRPDCAILWE